MSTKRDRPAKPRLFNARSGEVLKIWVGVRKSRDGEYQVRTEDPVVRVKGEGVFIVWRLRKSAQAWKFLGKGVSFRRDDGKQFIHPYRFGSGTEVALLDRNTRKGKFKYTVSLVHARNGQRRIREDPIIENEGEGRSM